MKRALLLATVLLAGLPAWGLEKGGMPDIAQVDNTCLPTSAANLMIWFGQHGYPKLILPGGTEDERVRRTVHLLMADTFARYDVGTPMNDVTKGLEAYIRHAGYACHVEYRGMEGTGTPFTQDWLRENDDPNKGFVLLLTYCHYHRETNSFSDAWRAGHAVTLVNAEPDLLLIHDPSHYLTPSGRKIVTPVPLKGGTFLDNGASIPVAGLLMLTGSELESPPHSKVMLTGAVCITMHREGPPSSAPVTAPNAIIAGSGGGSPGAAPAETSWWSWVLGLVWGK